MVTRYHFHTFDGFPMHHSIGLLLAACFRYRLHT